MFCPKNIKIGGCCGAFGARGEFSITTSRKIGQVGNKLWRDHLPYMGIRVRTATGYGKFDLVKDVAITPKRGQRIEIPVVNEFTLPKNQTSYQFPLYLGNKDKANAFQATLISPLFPLSQDTDCQVRLYYTYGAEQPYELYFIQRVEMKKLRQNGRFSMIVMLFTLFPIIPRP